MLAAPTTQVGELKEVAALKNQPKPTPTNFFYILHRDLREHPAQRDAEARERVVDLGRADDERRDEVDRLAPPRRQQQQALVHAGGRDVASSDGAGDAGAGVCTGPYITLPLRH